MTRALEIAVKYRITVYDSIFLACAFSRSPGRFVTMLAKYIWRIPIANMVRFIRRTTDPSGSTFDSRVAGRRASSLSLLFIVAIAAISGAYFGTATSQARNCNSQLSGKAGTPANLCLQTIAIDYSGRNSSEASVPVLLMQPGTTASVSILYEPHSDKGSAYNPQSQLTGFNIPTAISAISGQPNITAVEFSKGSLVFEQNNWTIYRYNITASNDSGGYYVIIVPFGPQLYPALVVAPSSASINVSEMSVWGYVGSITTGETVIPSVIVGESNLSVVNVTIPESQYCQTRACNIVASSQFYEG
jgi:hypothetical protein